MRWMVVVFVAVIGLGCSGTREGLVEAPAPTVVTEPAAVERPIIELTEQTEQQLEDHVRAAKRMLQDGDLETAAILLEEALHLDPTSKPARALQERLEKSQREAQEKTRRELISLYQREGNALLKEGDVGQALAYFRAAQELDPANRKLFQLIQRAYETQDELLAKQREQDFKERVRLAKADAQSATPTEVAGTEGEELIVLAAALAETPTAPVMAQEVSAPVPALEPAAPAGHMDTKAPTETPLPVVGEYTVQPEDVLQITVYEEEDLTTKTRVASTGEITFPLLGHVSVAGLTVAQVQEKLTNLLAADYIVNPQAQVFIDTALNPRRVVVAGAVNKPGSYSIPTERPTTLMEAIAMAGGFSEEAAINSTRIIRLENGQEKTILVRANDIMKKGDKTQDVVVRPSDIVFVPESFF